MEIESVRLVLVVLSCAVFSEFLSAGNRISLRACPTAAAVTHILI